jgi:gluconolactonase
MSGGSRAEASKRIEQLAPELEKIISPSEPIQELADGFGGPLGPAEGPVWWKEGGYLLFSDIHNNRRMKYEPGKGVSVFLEPTNRANGLTRDLQGRLIACEHDSRRVTRQELDGSITVVANSFQGRQLNRPNDVVVKSDGCIYFTDPWTNPAAPQPSGSCAPHRRARRNGCRGKFRAFGRPSCSESSLSSLGVLPSEKARSALHVGSP